MRAVAFAHNTIVAQHNYSNLMYAVFVDAAHGARRWMKRKMMKYAHTTEILRENDTYFVADLDNGGVRIGMKNVVAFDFPASHAYYENIRGLPLEECEEAIDEMYARHTPEQTDGYRNA